MQPKGGDVGRGQLTPSQLDAIDRVGGHGQLAAELGIDPDRVRTWWVRDNYGIQGLAVRSDLSPPLFLIDHAARIIRDRMANRVGR